MDMAEIFSSRADLSGIPENSSSELYVSKVIHKAIIEVNEEGTRAYGAGIGKYLYKFYRYYLLYIF